MKRKLKPSIWLYLAWAVMLIVCVVLNVTEPDITNIFISVMMFAIVLITFIFSGKRIDRIASYTAEFRQAAKKIRDAHDGSSSYISADGDLFKDSDLSKLFTEYKTERDRLQNISGGNYSCDISDYLNRELIDSAVNRNRSNLIPGVMTGLGILGTFVGLSIGLQSFNTDSADEITSSIAPLMNGIKVAFHTSIYGIIFSLIFNFIYKKALEEAYDAVDEFLDAYDTFVAPRSEYANESRMQMLISALPEQIGNGIAEVLKPTIEQMDKTLYLLAGKMEKKQVEGVSKIVDKFVVDMNSSLGENFVRLGNILGETCENQARTNADVRETLNKLEEVAVNVDAIGKSVNESVRKIAVYTETVDNLQQILERNLEIQNGSQAESVKLQKETEGCIRQLVDYETQISEASKVFSTDMRRQIETLADIENTITADTRKNISELAQEVVSCNKMLTDSVREYEAAIKKESDDRIREFAVSTQEYNRKLEESVREFEFAVTSDSKDSIKALSVSAQEYSKKLTDTANMHIGSIIEASNSVTGDIEKASEKLSQTTEKLTGDILEALETKFAEFNKYFAETEKHLGIAVDTMADTAGAVPEAVNRAYTDIENSFSGLRKTIDSINLSLRVVQKNVENTANRTNSLTDSDKRNGNGKNS